MDRDMQKILDDLQEKCRDPERQAEYERWVKENEERDAAVLMKRSGLPYLYREKGFDDFQVTDGTRAAYEACKAYVANWNGGSHSGIALFGDIGTGKSHLAAAVVRELILQHLVSARYANVLHTFEIARWSFDSEGVNPIPRLLKSAFLVLDDLGSERPTPWALEQSSHIIDYRLAEGLPMMITSNATTWNGLIKMLTYDLPGDPVRRSHLALPVSRIIDRLRESVGDPFVMKGKSWRARIAPKIAQVQR